MRRRLDSCCVFIEWEKGGLIQLKMLETKGGKLLMNLTHDAINCLSIDFARCSLPVVMQQLF